MDIKKLKELKTGSKVKINGIEYKLVNRVKEGKSSDEVKEWLLKDKNGCKYLLQVVLDNAPDLWKIEIDPLLKKPVFREEYLIEVQSIEF
jgi:hypothetical protein